MRHRRIRHLGPARTSMAGGGRRRARKSATSGVTWSPASMTPPWACPALFDVAPHPPGGAHGELGGQGAGQPGKAGPAPTPGQERGHCRAPPGGSLSGLSPGCVGSGGCASATNTEPISTGACSTWRAASSVCAGSGPHSEPVTKGERPVALEARRASLHAPVSRGGAGP